MRYAVKTMKSSDKIIYLHDRAQKHLNEIILPFWLKYAPDKVNGGFFGRITRSGTGIADAPKSLVLNARILWTFSAAYRMAGYPCYREAADRAFDYIMNHFIKFDSDFQGGYWLLNTDGSIREKVGDMHTYGQGFLLYALSEYAAMTGNPDSRKYAGYIFEFIEKQCRSGNYYTEKPFQNKAVGLSLSMNTHLHIIEPVTNYLRICKDIRAESSLINLILIFLNTIYDNKTNHQIMFFSESGKPLSDKFSFGHDIELSWLLTEAAEVLCQNNPASPDNMQLQRRCRECAVKIADSVYREGTDESCGALYDEGLPDGKIPHKNKIWWVQAEAVVGFYNAWQINGNPSYLDAACDVMEYIDRCLVDHDYGEWFGTGLDTAPQSKNGYKADEWKCPYHNSRMALELLARISYI